MSVNPLESVFDENADFGQVPVDDTFYDDVDEATQAEIDSHTRDLHRLKEVAESVKKDIIAVEEWLDDHVPTRAQVRIGQEVYKVTPVRSVMTNVDTAYVREHHPEIYGRCTTTERVVKTTFSHDALAEEIKLGNLTHQEARKFVDIVPKKTSIRMTPITPKQEEQG